MNGHLKEARMFLWQNEGVTPYNEKEKEINSMKKGLEKGC